MHTTHETASQAAGRRLEGEAPLVNVHTHGEGGEGALRIKNATAESFLRDIQNECFVSLGVHPWELKGNADVEDKLAHVRNWACHERVIAIGECGLDRLTEGFPERQESLLQAHMELAEALGKPLIIHCVRAFGELFRLIKASKVRVPVIVHGFPGHPQIAEDLLRRGIYISMGRAVLNPQSPAARLVSRLPIDRLFLETDDTDVAVGDVYAAAARLRHMPVDVLRNALYSNFREVFRICQVEG